MKIIRLQAENVKRLKTVDITPEGATVVVGGNNAQGKSSVLDAIGMALGGKRLTPVKALRDGTQAGSIKVQLGETEAELEVIKTLTERGESLTIKEIGTDKVFTSPQKMLDALFNKISFDPLQFLRMKDTAQQEILRQIAGIDFEGIDSKRAGIMESRKQNKKEKDRLQAVVESALIPDGVKYDSEIKSSAEITDRWNQAVQMNEEYENKRRVVEELRTERTKLVTDMDEARAEIGILEQKILEIQTSIAKLGMDDEMIVKSIEMMTEELGKMGPPADPNIVAEELKTLQAYNDGVRIVKTMLADRGKLDELVGIINRQTKDLSELDQKKVNQITAGKFPIEALTIDLSGAIAFRGLPFEQASQAEQLEAAVAIGLALNPKLKVLLIKDGSLLDPEHLGLLHELAVANDAQVWVERVGKGEECQIIMEDGLILDSVKSEE